MNPSNLQELSDEDLIKAHLQAADSDSAQASLKSTAAGRVMLEADADRRAGLVATSLSLWINASGLGPGKVASALLRGNLPDWTAARLAKVVWIAATLDRAHQQFTGFNWFPHKPLISAVENVAAKAPLPPELRTALERWKTAVSPRPLTASEERELGQAGRITEEEVANVPWSEMSEAFATFLRLERIRTPLVEELKLIQRLARVLSAREQPAAQEESPVLHIDTSDAVGIKIAADVARGGRAAGPRWAELLNHARTLASATPSKKWNERARQCAEAIAPDHFVECVADWFNEAGQAAPEKRLFYRQIADATLFSNGSVELLKGLAWTAVAAGRVELAGALGNLAEASYKKLPDIGPRNVKLGNAAVAALAAFAQPAAAAQLARLRLRVKHASSRAKVDKALTVMSEKTGLSPDELAEMSVPSFNLDAHGKRRLTFGDASCELYIVDSQRAGLRWQAGDGKACDTAPAAVRKNHAGELMRLQREVKDVSTMLAAQTLRLERSFLSNRSCPLEIWRERFLNHPLTGTLTRRLIWQLAGTTAIPWNGTLVDSANRPVEPKPDAVVSLWHPIGSSVEVITHWRTWIEQHEVTQPFKQAHREIYVLTDAERRTNSYSNRFAGHILRQHQFAALCAQRGWDYRLQGQFDSHSTPTLRIPAHLLSAEYWVEPVPNEATAQGIFLHLAADQVRFGCALKDVPPIVFSEVMRDVDLFVGVSSVANDPTWRDSGTAGRFREYWEQASFGELSENAKTRRSALERLLPRLSGPDRFALKDKFLVVQGSLRTYKIHLGSGNILMEPNDQYLCIVPDRRPDAIKSHPALFLPFEGDPTLSVILSKALLLADDTRIKDQTILRQIKS